MSMWHGKEMRNLARKTQHHADKIRNWVAGRKAKDELYCNDGEVRQHVHVPTIIGFNTHTHACMHAYYRRATIKLVSVNVNIVDRVKHWNENLSARHS